MNLKNVQLLTELEQQELGCWINNYLGYEMRKRRRPQQDMEIEMIDNERERHENATTTH